MNPKYLNGIYQYASFLQDEKKDFRKAREYYEMGLKIEPTNLRFLHAHSGCLAQMNEIEEAEKTYLLAMKYYPQDVDVLRSYAHFLSAYKKNDEAAENLNFKLLQIIPDDPYVLINVRNY